MDTARVYYNLMGEPRTIWQMLREEPEWSANRIQAAEDALARAEAAERDNARLREALEEIARQKLTDELETEADVEYADFEEGYDCCIRRARAALKEQP